MVEQGFELDVGVRSCATALGETEISRQEIAARHGVPEAVVQKWLGDCHVYETVAGSIYPLALRAAAEALERAQVEAADLSLIVAGGTSALRLQHDLGAAQAYALDAAAGCAELASMICLSGSLLYTGPARGPALLVCADQMPLGPLRAFGRITDLIMRDVFSDGAAALVLERSHPRLKLLGTGTASDGSHWDYFDRVSNNDPVNDIEVMMKAVPIMYRALQRCLESAALPLDAFQWVMFPLEGPRLPLSLARAMRIPQDKIYLNEDGPTHVGMSDPIFMLQSYLGSGRAVEGDRILVAIRAIGIMRVLAFQV